jgi:hypothetical protein
MKKYKKSFAHIAFTIAIAFVGCKKTEYSFGEIKTPTNFTATTTIVGASIGFPTGDGSGKVNIKATATNALSYNIDFGDGHTAIVPNGDTTYKYANPGVSDYNITITAVGTGGSISTLTKKVTLFVDHTIPPAIMDALTNNGTSQVWQTDHDASGHFGVGPNTDFSPIWYAATPNSREACAYDDEITFTKTGVNKISMSVNNNGETFVIAAAISFYGLSGAADKCFPLATASKALVFTEATSASTSANSTREQFTVPGNGIVNFGTGGTTYEILAITPTTMTIRNIGADGNSWYQKLKVKP